MKVLLVAPPRLLWPYMSMINIKEKIDWFREQLDAGTNEKTIFIFESMPIDNTIRTLEKQGINVFQGCVAAKPRRS